MPVRTSAVVAAGLLLLGVVGVTTIFGESLRAWIAPPDAEALSSPVAGGLSSKAGPSAVPPPAGADTTGRTPPMAVPPAASPPGAGGAAERIP